MTQKTFEFEEPQVERILLGFGGMLCMHSSHPLANTTPKILKESCSQNDVTCSLTKAVDFWRLPIHLQQLKPLELLVHFDQHCCDTIRSALTDPGMGTLNTQHIHTKAGLFPDTKGRLCAIVHVTGAHLYLHQWQMLQTCWQQRLHDQTTPHSAGIATAPNFWISKSFDQWALHDLGTSHNPYAQVLQKQYSKNFS